MWSGASASRRFAAVRLRRAAAKRFKKVENATAVIWKTLPIAKKTFRQLDAPELLADLASGVVYINGVRVVNRGDKKVGVLRPPSWLPSCWQGTVSGCFSGLCRLAHARRAEPEGEAALS